MVHLETVWNMPIARLREAYPFVDAFFEDRGFEVNGQADHTLGAFLGGLRETASFDETFDARAVAEEICTYVDQMLAFLGADTRRVCSLTVLAGRDKQGRPEGFERLELLPGHVVSIVGPTGSGKSRLLADIEWMAQGDTPTGRSILVNGGEPDPEWRFSPQHKLVAQLSQNMNFVMDLSVVEFLELHAESRLVADPDAMVQRVFEAGNELAGEPFEKNTPITALSGGQSRALMIADTAILSRSPIVLIDEIENAGIDRKRALERLVGEEKIVLMATHDPILALMGDRRIVLRSGGIAAVLETTDEERAIAEELERMDQRQRDLRERLRHGERLTRTKTPGA
ncbi:MAG: ATP-binding cassette domain-containing protein [Planctomycetes bacterium]|nr:ATP-binding cassette domain-containing protein [Planctomycetota bacterium]